MALDHARFTRQIRLPEVGEAGQARICASEVPLRSEGAARGIERTYLALAGARPVEREVEPGAPSRRETLPDLGLAHAAAREVGQGAMAALLGLRAILELR